MLSRWSIKSYSSDRATGCDLRPIRNLRQRCSATALRRAAEGESTRTIVIALLANIVIGIAKLIAGLASRSTGMLAEAAHSAADSVNEVFLAVGYRRFPELGFTKGARLTPTV